ncbi:MAG: hypothetical protein AAF363_14915 [Bacteroidota bacterium]
MINSLSDQHIVFETEHAKLIQDDRSELFILNFDGDEIFFRLCQLMAFKRKLNQINIVSLLSSKSPDIELINMPHCDRFFAFSIHEILELRELLYGSFTMLELNSLIHKTLVRNID